MSDDSKLQPDSGNKTHPYTANGKPIQFLHLKSANKTVALLPPKVDDLNFAVNQLVDQSGSGTVVLALGVSRVSDGNPKKYKELKKQIAELKKNRRDGSVGPEFMELNKDVISRLQSELPRVKPDKYCYKTGREQSALKLQDVEGKVVSCMVTRRGCTYVVQCPGGVTIHMSATHGTPLAYASFGYPSQDEV